MPVDVAPRACDAEFAADGVVEDPARFIFRQRNRPNVDLLDGIHAPDEDAFARDKGNQVAQGGMRDAGDRRNILHNAWISVAAGGSGLDKLDSPEASRLSS